MYSQPSIKMGFSKNKIHVDFSKTYGSFDRFLYPIKLKL